MTLKNRLSLHDKNTRDKFSTVKALVFDFDGVFTDNRVLVNQDGVESVTCWRSDGLGLSRVRKLGIKTLIISTEKNQVVSTRAKKLNIECIQAVDDKAHVLKEWSIANNVLLSDVVFVGNDINDIPAFKISGISIAVKDAYLEAIEFADFSTESCGGYGAVREVCDIVWNCQKERQ